MKSNADVASIARQRERLCADYYSITKSSLNTYVGRQHWPTKAMSQCITTFRRQFLAHYFWSPPRWRVWLRELQKDRALPDFCIIGPIKSGTSDLAVTIMSHPNVLCPLVKEFRSADPQAWRPFYPTIRTVQRHAQRHGVALCPFVGPCLHSLDIAMTLSAIHPNTKIVINLRDPADLVFSEWKWTVLNSKRQLVDRLPFLATFPAYVDKAIELFPAVPAPLGRALHFGIYAPSVAQWLRSFGRPNVRVFDVADYFKDRNSYFERLEGFLGLPHVALPQRLPVANPNPLSGLAVSPDTSAKLRDFFEPYNRRLWDVIGAKFGW